MNGDTNGSERSPKRLKFSDDTNGPSYRPYKHRLNLTGHEKAISAIKIAHNGSRIATSSADATIKVWTIDGALENTLSAHSKGISDVSWSLDDQYLVSASDDCTCRVWKVSDGRCLRILHGHTNFVLCCEFNRATSIVASGSFDESIKLWNTRSGTCLRTLPAHSDPVASVNFSLDGTLLVSSSHDSQVRIWDVGTGQCLKTLVDQDSPPMGYAMFSPNGMFLVSCTLDSTIRIWNFVSSVPVKTFKGHVNVKYTLNAEVGNQEIIIGGEDGKVTIWDTQTKDILQIIQNTQQVVLSVSRCELNGRRLLAVAGLDMVARIYSDT